MKNYDIIKTICRKIYLTGSGDFWFEEGVIGNDKSFIYILLSTILFLDYILMTIFEIVAMIWSELPEDEKRDCITFSVSHTMVLFKIFSVMGNRKQVKELNRKIVEICKDHEDENRLVDSYRIMKINIVAFIFICYGSVSCFVLEGVRKMRAEGAHFITIVTYWPFYEDNSLTALLFRIFTTASLYVLMATMITVDGIVMVILIMYKYKLITLRHYFEGLRTQFDQNNYKGNRENAANELYAGLKEGIVMHRDLLSLKKDIDRSFGTVLALQVCLSSGSAVTLLLQLALTQGITFAHAMKVLLFLIGVFFILALFVCNAGEITYQASLLSDAIFYCGWHLCPKHRDLRRLVLMSCGAAQRPLVMKAFMMLELTYGTFLQASLFSDTIFYCGWHLCPSPKHRDLRRLALMSCGAAQRPLVMKAFMMLELTYGTFIQVLRTTYSVFALLYAQNK